MCQRIVFEGTNLLPDLTDIAPCYYFSDEVTEAVVVAAGQTMLSAAGAAPQAARHPLLARQVGREHPQTSAAAPVESRECWNEV